MTSPDLPGLTPAWAYECLTSCGLIRGARARVKAVEEHSKRVAEKLKTAQPEHTDDHTEQKSIRPFHTGPRPQTNT